MTRATFLITHGDEFVYAEHQPEPTPHVKWCECDDCFYSRAHRCPECDAEMQLDIGCDVCGAETVAVVGGPRCEKCLVVPKAEGEAA